MQDSCECIHAEFLALVSVVNLMVHNLVSLFQYLISNHLLRPASNLVAASPPSVFREGNDRRREPFEETACIHHKACISPEARLGQEGAMVYRVRGTRQFGNKRGGAKCQKHRHFLTDFLSFIPVRNNKLGSSLYY
jgi:hypothetical protein